MANVDDRVVAMSFEYTKFSQGVTATLGMLGKLGGALKNLGSTSGFDNIEKSANKVKLTGLNGALDKAKSNLASVETAAGQIKLSGLNNALDGIRTKFSVIQGAAAVALGNIATRATMAGGRIAKALTIDPVMAGFQNYETQIQAVQTIMANTGLSGKQGLGQITGALNELNDYANKTIYNFSEMAKNIGTFTAAGVDLKTATGSIKGIANLAAASGSTSMQASTAMYQLSQAIAAGKVSLQDWNSVVNAGMGGQMFQKALANTAEAMGTLGKGSVKLVGPMKQLTINGESFRNAIQAKPGQKSWLTSDVLTTALKEFTGDMSKAQLAAIGFNAEQIKAIQTQAKTAVNAATQIKTATQMFQALKEEVATAWAAVFKTIFGGIGGATQLFTSLHNTIQNALTNPIIHVNKLLEGWVKLGGKTDFFAGIKAAAKDLSAILGSIRGAFRQIFPPTTAKNLADASKHFRNLMESLKPGVQTVANIRRTFAGFFALFDIGKQIISGVLHFFGLLFGNMEAGAGSIGAFTAHIGDVLVAFDEWLKKGQWITRFFERISFWLEPVTHWLGQFGSNMHAATAAVAGSTVAVTAAKAWDKLLSALKAIGHFLKPVVDAIVGVFRNTAGQIEDALKHQNFNKIFAIIQTTFIGGIYFAIKKALGGGLTFDFGGDALKKTAGAIDALKGSLRQLQTGIQATTLVAIATAVALIAGSVVLLSSVPANRLKSAMSGIAVAFGELLASLAILTKIDLKTGFLKIGPAAGALILLAIAADLLTIGVTHLSKLNWDQLLKGLAGMGILLASISAAAVALRFSSARIAIMGAGLIELAIALNIMLIPLKVMSSMSLVELAKGLGGIGAALFIIAAGMRAMPQHIFVTSAALILLGAGLASVSVAVKAFGVLPLAVIAKGILGIGAALVVLGASLKFLPPGLPAMGLGLIAVGAGLNIVASAIKSMGSMGLGTLAKGIVGLSLALRGLAWGVMAMDGALPGAAALLVISGALLLLGPALAIIGSLSFKTVGKALLFIGGSLLVIAAAGLIAAPALAALGGALIVMGIGVLTVGAGIYLIAQAVSLLAGKGVKGVTLFLAAMTALIAALPALVINFLKGAVEILSALATLAPKVVASLVTITGQLLNGLILLIPKMVLTIEALISGFIKLLDDKGGPIIAAGFRFFMKFLTGVSQNIGPITAKVAEIIGRFLNALANNIGQIIDAGANLLVKLLYGLGRDADKIVGGAVTFLIKFAAALGKNAWRLIEAGANLVVKVLGGLGNKKSLANIGSAVVSLVGNLMDTFAKKVPELAGRAFDALHAFLWNLAWIARNKTPEIVQDFVNLGIAIVKGLSKGIGKAAVDLATSPFEIIGSVLDGVVSEGKKKLGVSSPSRVFMELGKNVVAGLSLGISANAEAPKTAASNMLQSVIDTAHAMSQDIDGHIEIRPTITPVMDLTQVKKDAQTLRGMTTVPQVIPITAATSYKQARTISVEKPVVADKPVTPAVDKGPKHPTTFTFEQNNYSPEALSEREIYRQTHNQLSQVRTALKL